MRIVLADVQQDTLETAVKEIQSLGAETLGVRTDVGDLQQVQALADRAFAHFGAAHLVFNNAGVAIFGPIQEMKHEDWEWVLRVDLWGVIHGVEAFVPRMIAQNQGGHIVNTASFAGLVPNEGLGVYCVAKYGVVALSECLFRDLRPHGIGVSVLCPMGVSTQIRTSERNRPAALRNQRGERRDTGDATPVELMGATLSAAEVASKVVRAIYGDELYVITHDESLTPIRKRFQRIEGAITGS